MTDDPIILSEERGGGIANRPRKQYKRVNAVSELRESRITSSTSYGRFVNHDLADAANRRSRSGISDKCSNARSDLA
jgi:hypothetical protein